MAEEMYDVLDAAGNKTGQVLPKSAVHEQELWHASVFIWIYNSKGEVLIQFRDKSKKSFPSVWDVSVAGHMSAGDEPLDTCVREVKEEIGLEISAEELMQVGYTFDVPKWLPDKKHPEFCWVYILHKDIALEDLKIQQSELTDLKWMAIAEIESLLDDPDFDKTYADRKRTMYTIPFHEIIKRLGK